MPRHTDGLTATDELVLQAANDLIAAGRRPTIAEAWEHGGKGRMSKNHFSKHARELEAVGLWPGLAPYERRRHSEPDLEVDVADLWDVAAAVRSERPEPDLGPWPAHPGRSPEPEPRDWNYAEVSPTYRCLLELLE